MWGVAFEAGSLKGGGNGVAGDRMGLRWVEGEKEGYSLGVVRFEALRVPQRALLWAGQACVRKGSYLDLQMALGVEQ